MKVGRLIRTEPIKLIDYRTDLPAVLGIGIDIVQVVSKRRKFSYLTEAVIVVVFKLD